MSDLICNGLCIYANEILEGGPHVVAYAHDECEKHGLAYQMRPEAAELNQAGQENDLIRLTWAYIDGLATEPEW
jgi:hypothetical protein